VDLGSALLAWYRPRQGRYPWRRSRPDPYRVLVSEVMLQQTQAARVVPVYRAFLRRFPSVPALAGADRGAVLRAWNGLGYNRRAVALHEAARAIVRDHRGMVPRHPDVLVSLPGVGPYTAAAVASIAYGLPVPALDTNIRRVVGRFALGVEPWGVRESVLRGAAERLVERAEPGMWNQAVMDLGRDVCRPVPMCGSCPLAAGCLYRRSGGKGGRRPRQQGAFAGSFRQLRGAVVRALAAGGALTMGGLAATTGEPIAQVTRAVEALVADGIVRAGRGALEGNRRGRVRLGEPRP
jgi:A/G-specific adenine glycosylase